MGDAFTDSQHINDWIMSVESRDLGRSCCNDYALAQSPYNYNKIRLWEEARQDSVYWYKWVSLHINLKIEKLNLRVSFLTTMKKRLEKIWATCDHTSKLIQKCNILLFNVSHRHKKRNSTFIRLDFNNQLKKSRGNASKWSINKQSTLHSIIEHPSEWNNIQVPITQNNIVRFWKLTLGYSEIKKDIRLCQP